MTIGVIFKKSRGQVDKMINQTSFIKKYTQRKFHMHITSRNL